ncbi:MAG: MbtG protein [Chloroflexi bacterium]|nr:MbtG protein [Chloroflexota bacterium]
MDYLEDRESCPTMAVIGAGPKAIAIAAKVDALRRSGLQVPNLIVIEKQGVAAHWTGAYGYTNGTQTLGTPAEKDVGFPYYGGSWDADGPLVVTNTLRDSWQGYLVGCGHFADWVDRGRPRPTHRQWAAYLRWVAENIKLKLLAATVTRIDIVDARWVLTCRNELDATTAMLASDGLAITGTGPPRTVPGQVADHLRVLDGRNFWQHTGRLAALPSPVSVCVIGTGETAASIAVELLRVLKSGSTVEVVTPQGVLYSRGESFFENQLYSNPLPEWPHLAESHRREFLNRTDRGVFSVQAEQALNSAPGCLRTLAGRVTRLEVREAEVLVYISYQHERECAAYDSVVVAIGFDPVWFEPLLSNSARMALRNATGIGPDTGITANDLERIEFDLGVENLHPRLHLPMLAGLAQGPGFPNLSCLGLMADRILQPYVNEGRYGLVQRREAVFERR